MKTIILRKTLKERLTKPWEPKGEELTNRYLGQLREFLDSHNNDIESAQAEIRALVQSGEISQRNNNIFARLILVDKTEEIIVRLFMGIFETLKDKREIEIRFI